MSEKGEITRLLHAYAGGDRAAFDELVPLIYDELRRIARNHLRRTQRGATLDTNGLVHEAYLKLAGTEGHARRGPRTLPRHRRPRHAADHREPRSRASRGEARRRGHPDDFRRGARSPPRETQAEWLLDLDRALEGLRERDERLARTVECRFFAGLSEDETAEALGVSLRTAQRNWMRARAWIRSELTTGKAG